MFPSNGNVVTKHHRTDKREGGGGQKRLRKSRTLDRPCFYQLQMQMNDTCFAFVLIKLKNGKAIVHEKSMACKSG